jgi:hypothetical protein
MMHHRGMVRLVILGAGLWLAVGPAGTAAAGADRDAQRTTILYHVGDLARTSASWRLLQPQPALRDGPDGIEAVARAILSTVDPEGWHGDNGSTLREMNGTMLEITATHKQHNEIQSLINALRRLAEVSVVIESELYEADRDFYDKHLAEKLAKGPAAVAEAVAEQLRGQGSKSEPGKATIRDGQAAPCFSLRQTFVYRTRPAAAERDPAKALAAGLHGLSVRAQVGVSADRTEVRLTLTRQLTELVELRKMTRTDPETGAEGEVEIPELRESSVTSSVQVGDGLYVVVPLPGEAAKDAKRVSVLLLRPTIRIEEEDRARQGLKP